MFLHLVDAEQAVFLNGFDDGAFAHAVATADFGAVGHDHGFVLALMSYVSECVFSEHEVIADLANGVILTNLPEIPTAICRIAVQTGAD
ncbi:hypothetical protein D3C72_1119520 [compost metagenome]